MIYGTGIDLVHIKRMEKVIERWGDRFIHRVFTPGEAEICYNRAYPAAAFSLRFAAKEAVSKALGTGIGRVSWREIEIANDATGRPELALSGRAAELAIELNLHEWSISLSHTQEQAIAFVVAAG